MQNSPNFPNALCSRQDTGNCATNFMRSTFMLVVCHLVGVAMGNCVVGAALKHGFARIQLRSWAFYGCSLAPTGLCHLLVFGIWCTTIALQMVSLLLWPPLALLSRVLLEDSWKFPRTGLFGGSNRRQPIRDPGGSIRVRCARFRRVQVASAPVRRARVASVRFARRCARHRRRRRDRIDRARASWRALALEWRYTQKRSGKSGGNAKAQPLAAVRGESRKKLRRRLRALG